MKILTVDLRELINCENDPKHWSKSSIYRLRSIRLRLLRNTKDFIIPIEELLIYINTVDLNTGNIKNSISPHSDKTYRSTIPRLFAERLSKRSMKPWEAIRFIKSLNKPKQHGQQKSKRAKFKSH
jgi:hypothetical protein